MPRSPFSPYIEGKSGDASQCRAHGPGLEPSGVMVDKPTWFEIDATSKCSLVSCSSPILRIDVLDAGNGLAEVILVDPRGRQDAVPVSVKQTGPGRFRCEYVPREPGLHSVNVFFAGRPIPNSPFGVNVASCRSMIACSRRRWCQHVDWFSSLHQMAIELDCRRPRRRMRKMTTNHRLIWSTRKMRRRRPHHRSRRFEMVR